MAKEIQIFFVYDTQNTEANDTLEGMLYFYPTWVPQEQKAALCGQIIGTIQCIKHLFSKPDIISLNNGKFVVIEQGRFFFVLGTDKNTPSIFLQNRAKSLYTILEFFHKDLECLQTISSINLSHKLHYIVDGYLKLLNLAGKLCAQKPLSQLSKGSNDTFIEALQFLDYCKSCNYVLGGMITYRNRLIASQLCSLLTQLLLLTETGRIQIPSNSIKSSFNLPSEVQLYEVYISNKEYVKLLNSTQANNIFSVLRDGTLKKSTKSSRKGDNSILAVMKREQSLLFTSVPEEESSTTCRQECIPIPKKNRPRCLNLESVLPKSNTFKGLKYVGDSSSQIIVCNTPLQEQKKIVHFNPLLICHNQASDNKPVRKDSNGNVSREQILNTCYGHKPEILNEKKFCVTKSFVPFERKSFYYKTLADPSFPMFRQNGKLASVDLYQQNKAKLMKSTQNLEIKTSKSYEDLENLYKYTRWSPSNKDVIRWSVKNRIDPRVSDLEKKAVLNCFPETTTFFNSNFKTPSALENKNSILKKPNFDFNFKKFTKKTEEQDTIRKCNLFLLNHEDIVLTILLTEEVCQETFTLLGDICTKYLNKLETKIRYNTESQSFRENEAHKFVSLDLYTHLHNEDILWDGTSDEWRDLNYFSEDFTNSNFSEVLIRGKENILYNYHCGPTKMFYSEMCTCNGGLPLPADPLGILRVKAKRRIERDYALILF